jgi:hypothetical protein
MINTRLPVVIAVPRYRVDEKAVEDEIVVELYVLSMEKRDIRNIYILIYILIKKRN